MVKNLYARLAFGNLKKNRRIYLPYILTCIITVMMFYMIYSLYTNESIAAMHGGQTIQYTLNFGTVIVGIFAVIFLFYTNSFVIRRRQKEFGLFNVSEWKNGIWELFCCLKFYTSVCFRL